MCIRDRIMSIHKSKGLEFPVCIVAGCGRNFITDHSDVLLHPELGLGVKLRDPILPARFTTAAREAIRLETARNEASEELRVLYVAMTRAKSYLHIYSLKEQYGKKLTPSRFIGEYHLDLAGLVEGAPVNHVKYGDGVIRAVQNNKVKIYFPKPGKELLLDIHYCMSYQLLRLTASKGLNGRKVQ